MMAKEDAVTLQVPTIEGTRAPRALYSTQRLQNTLIKEYTLNYNGNPNNMI